MKHFILSLASISLALSSPAWAYNHHMKPAAVDDKRCAMTPSDPYERPARITSDSWLFNGRCVNSDRRRPPHVFTNYVDDGYLAVTNIRHKNEYWVAYIPTGDDFIKAIHFLVLKQKVVTVYTGHAQLEVFFNEPVILRSQLNPAKTESVSEIYISYESTIPQGVSEEGLMGELEGFLSIERGMFPLVGRLATDQQRQDEDGPLYPQYHRYPMKLSNEENSAVFWSAITESDHYGFSRPFQVWESNCISTLVNLVDELPRIHAMGLPPFKHRLSWDPDLGVGVRDMHERGIIDLESPSQKDGKTK